MVTCEVEDSGSAIELRLTGDAVMATAAMLHERLLGAVVAGRDVNVDVDGLDRLDGAGVQLLIALKTLVERGGASMTVRATADVPRAAIENAAAGPSLLTP